MYPLQTDGHYVRAPGGVGAAGARAGVDALPVERDGHVYLALVAGHARLHPGRQVEPDLQRLMYRARPVAGSEQGQNRSEQGQWGQTGTGMGQNGGGVRRGRASADGKKGTK